MQPTQKDIEREAKFYGELRLEEIFDELNDLTEGISDVAVKEWLITDEDRVACRATAAFEVHFCPGDCKDIATFTRENKEYIDDALVRNLRALESLLKFHELIIEEQLFPMRDVGSYFHVVDFTIDEEINLDHLWED